MIIPVSNNSSVETRTLLSLKTYSRCTHIFMYLCMYVCMCVCMYVRTCVCVYVCMYVCVYVCMYVCMYVCVYVCMYVCTEDLMLYDPYRCSLYRWFGVTSCGPAIVAIRAFRELVFMHVSSLCALYFAVMLLMTAFYSSYTLKNLRHILKYCLIAAPTSLLIL